MKLDERCLPVALLAVTLAWCVGLALIGAHESILYLVPTLLLAAPLAIRRYPGEEILRSLAARPRPRHRRGFRPAAPACPGLRFVPRGALLLATSLAGRAPPAAAPIA